MSETNLLKYCGSKAKLVDTIKPYIPATITTIYEPFCGSASLSFSLGKDFYLSDSSTELVNFLQCVKEDPDGLISRLKELPISGDQKELYMALRQQDRRRTFRRSDKLSRAARYYYIVYKGFNGLYRVNKKGHCNTPYGGDHRNYPDDLKKRVSDASKILNDKCKGIHECSFADQSLLQSVVDGLESPSELFVFIDPPYHGTFDQYTPERLSEEFWEDLQDYLVDLNEAGVKFLLTNSYCDYILERFSCWSIDKIPVKYTVAADGTKRGQKFEAFIYN